MAIKKTTKPKKKSNRESIKSLKDKIEGLKKQLLEEKEEHQHIIDKNIRLLAEFDNYKRRTQEERIELLKYGGKALAKSLLPILDDLHRTMETDGKTKSRSILDGVELIITKLDKTFIEEGIISFESIGEEFNPDCHEALMSEKSNKDDNIILKEFEKGYMYNDKILRHAKVVVSKN